MDVFLIFFEMGLDLYNQDLEFKYQIYAMIKYKIWQNYFSINQN